MSINRHVIQRDRPGPRVDITVESFSNPRVPEFRQLPWRRRWAWRLRHLATRLEGRNYGTYVFSARLPATTTRTDWWDAICFGLTAMERYLTDLHNDRCS